MIGKTCGCGRVHATGEVVAVGRFDPINPTLYRAAARGGPGRETRQEAQRDVCPQWGDR